MNGESRCFSRLPFTVHRSPFTAGRASIKPITSDQYPLPATRPRSPITNKGKIKRVFGMEMPDWEKQLRAFLAGVADERIGKREW